MRESESEKRAVKEKGVVGSKSWYLRESSFTLPLSLRI